MSKTVIAVGVILLLLIGGWYLTRGSKAPTQVSKTTMTSSPTTTKQPVDVMEQKMASSSGGAMVEGTAVTIQNFAFSPKTVTVKKGAKVTWTNQDAVSHTVTSDTGVELASELIGNGKSFSHVFNTVGSFAYHCTPHPNMKGTVVVTE